MSKSFSNKNLNKKSIDKEEFRVLFQEAKSRYGEIESTNIFLMFRKEWFFTMRASFRIGSMFNGKRNYFITVNLNKEKFLSELSQGDIVGWFGHELAHIIEYKKMSNTELFFFTLRYMFDLRFRFSVERRVNVFACNNGFFKELFGVWKKFLSMNSISKRYKKYIIKHYRPDWEDISELASAQGINKESYESLV
jgi:hypothetical protein